MPKRPFRVSRRTLAVIAAAIIAALTAAGVIQPIDSSPPAPPAHTPAPALQAPRAIAGDELVGHDHTGLADTPGERELGHLPAASAPADPIGGCTVRFNQHNFSSRHGAPIKLLVAHYTVSRNVPGWADVNANAAFLDQPSTQASANFIVDDEGHCLYTVPISLKAWTQAGANPYAVSIEFVDMGTEAGLSAAALDRGGRIFAEVATRAGIPVRLGQVKDCFPLKAGIVDHGMLGACGGGHHDLRPLNGTHVPPRASEDTLALAPLIAATRRYAQPITRTDRVTCRKLNWWRQHGRPHGAAERNAIRRRNALASRGVRCTAHGPVRAASALT